ncbi:DNA repair protein RAD51 homolog 3-like isoform X1 [Littorina saxatilis]|uniref:DNA repair protein RAD51 homolog 3 n=1 Tax=Littorina saxatilis TaxID=31220 RepID=A0AAN9FYR2_9CAEN
MACVSASVAHSQRELLTFPLAPAIRAKLSSAGFLTVADLNNVKPSQLSKEAGIALEDALEVVKIISGEGKTPMPSQSALELLEQEQNLPSIVTFCAKLDGVLGGGVTLRQVTEICGAPGVGKTQMCIQLAVDASIPEELGGAGGEAVYIDTEGSFIVERVADIAMATADHCHRMAASADDVDIGNYTMETILAGIHYFRCHDHIELLATIHLLTTFVQKHPKVRVIVVDSIAFPFRHNFDDLSMRTRLLTSMAQSCIQLATNFDLAVSVCAWEMMMMTIMMMILTSMAQSCIQLATNFDLAVVLTNQMTTRFTLGSNGSQLMPALGESWGHACTVRLILFWENSQRHAMLYKSPSHRETTVLYQITTGGIRDVISRKTCSDHEPQEADGTESAVTKRPRLA